jgi:U3 small nucleolar RNA-associated protein 14
VHAYHTNYLLPMARSRSGRQGKTTVSTRKSKNSAYGNRKSHKAKDALISEVYEHQQEKVRRGTIKPVLDREEMVDGAHGSDSEDDNGHGSVVGAKRARLIGEFMDDEKIDSEDDEEIDSDDAFDEEDEEQFAGIAFRRVRSVHFVLTIVN